MKKLFFLNLLLCASMAFAQKFTLATIPDLQYATQSCPAVTDTLFSWLARHKDSLNLKYVMQVGDFTNGATTSQWTSASNAIKYLEDDSLPYIISPGNHDYTGGDGHNGTLTGFNAAFPVSRMQAVLQKTSYAQWGGSYPAGTNSNSYHLFTAGGVNWVMLELEYEIGSDAGTMTWANTVATTYASRKIIVVTHDYLANNGTLSGAGGSPIWSNLVNKHNNFMFVVCGHTWPIAKTTTTTSLGNPVYQYLTDWQNSGTPCSSDNTLIRLMSFDTQNKQLSTTTYSPNGNVKLTDAANQFIVTNIDFGTIVAIGPQGDRAGYALPTSLAGVNKVRIFSIDGRLVQEFAVRAGAAEADEIIRQFTRRGVYIVAMYENGGLVAKRSIVVP
jgi:hypothetical protein